MHKKRFFTVSFAVAAALIIFSALTIFALNTYVMTFGGQYIITPEAAEKLEDIDCIIVLGCLVYDDGTPSDRLADRIQGGIDLYFRGVAPKIIMSGDHGREDYDEVGAMKRTAIVAGVPSSDIFMDHAGFSTYESIYRAKEIFGADKIVIVTQKYHLYRALYIADRLGVEAYGVSTDYNTYPGQMKREIREVLARCKDIVYTTFKPEPDFLGDKISISGDGDLTNDYPFSKKTRRIIGEK